MGGRVRVRGRIVGPRTVEVGAALPEEALDVEVVVRSRHAHGSDDEGAAAMTEGNPTLHDLLGEIWRLGAGRPTRAFWGEVGELEVHVCSDGSVVLSKGYRQHGASVEHPWLKLTEAELRELVVRWGEIVRAAEDAKRSSEADR